MANWRVSCLPSGDAAFCAVATRAFEAIDRRVDPQNVSGLLATALSPIHPNVEVHRQHPFAKFFEEEVWYVYRDGKPLGQVGDSR